MRASPHAACSVGQVSHGRETCCHAAKLHFQAAFLHKKQRVWHVATYPNRNRHEVLFASSRARVVRDEVSHSPFAHPDQDTTSRLPVKQGLSYHRDIFQRHFGNNRPCQVKPGRFTPHLFPKAPAPERGAEVPAQAAEPVARHRCQRY